MTSILVLTLSLFSIAEGQYLSREASRTLREIKGKTLLLRETPNDNQKGYALFDRASAIYIHQKSRLFPLRQPEFVQITDIVERGNSTVQWLDYIQIEYKSEKRGTGRVRIYGAYNPEMINLVIRKIFVFPETQASYVLNTESGQVHYIGSNHLPSIEHSQPLTVEQLDSTKHSKCGLCFARTMKVENYELEVSLGAYVTGQINARQPILLNEAIQRRFKEAGHAVLSKWPVKLKGYKYNFSVLDSEELNAYAAPGGRIYITLGLLETVESETELETIIAHEIAHVEQRHGIRQYLSAQTAASWGALLTGAVAIATKNSDVVNAALLIVNVATEITLSGHSRRYESEADSLAFIYFKSNGGKDLSSFTRVLQKLQYKQDLYNPNGSGRSVFASHPGIDERIALIRLSEFQLMSNEFLFIGYDKDDEVVTTVEFQSQRSLQTQLPGNDPGLQIVVNFENTSVLLSPVEIEDLSIRTTDGEKTKLTAKEGGVLVPGESTGAVFSTNKTRLLKSAISEVDIKIKGVVRWERVSKDVDFEF